MAPCTIYEFSLYSTLILLGVQKLLLCECLTVLPLLSVKALLVLSSNLKVNSHHNNITTRPENYINLFLEYQFQYIVKLSGSTLANFSEF